MISIISPAKTLDFETPALTNESTQPIFISEAEAIMRKLRKTSRKKIASLMDLSQSLTELNYERYQNWEPNFEDKNAKQAILAFKGDVYLGFEAETLEEKEISYCQNHLRILSGLHGVLRPLDMIRPYRLEMGTSVSIGRRKDLYHFWKDKIYKQLNQDLEHSGSPILLNLASNEYFGAIDTKKIKGDIIKADFKDFKNGQYKVLSFFAKKARGAMARFITNNEINELEGVKTFDWEGYVFNSELSQANHLVFTRG